MATLQWLAKLAKDKSEDVVDVSEECWEAILSDVPNAPDVLKSNPHTLGKNAVVSTLGLMLYMPALANQLADSFGRGADIETGTRKHLQGKGYLPKVSQALEASAQMINSWSSQVEGRPRIGMSETTEDIRRLLPLFQEQLSEKAKKMKEEMVTAEEHKANMPSLFMEEGNVTASN